MKVALSFLLIHYLDIGSTSKLKTMESFTDSWTSLFIQAFAQSIGRNQIFWPFFLEHKQKTKISFPDLKAWSNKKVEENKPVLRLILHWNTCEAGYKNKIWNLTEPDFYTFNGFLWGKIICDFFWNFVTNSTLKLVKFEQGFAIWRLTLRKLFDRTSKLELTSETVFAL